MTDWSTDRATADRLDEADAFGEPFRRRFEIPPPPEGVSDTIYFVGNSLGAMPSEARVYVDAEMERWSKLGVTGHFKGGPGWADYHSTLTEPMARIIGAKPHEVVVMNALTINLHLLLISFYRPTPERFKILIEEHAFPSDHFAVESQIRLHGFDPAEAMVIVAPRPGEETLRVQDIIATIEEHGDSLATILLPGVQYYTGQVLPMDQIAAAGHRVGATVGVDHAHAVGNLELSLHDDDVDFATWCTYKYLNSGPGGVSGIFVNERHVDDQSLPKLLGWWGTKLETRFEMENRFDPPPTADSWQVSNGSALSMATLAASLQVFDDAGGMAPLRAKSEVQTAYMLYLLDEILPGRIATITPRDPAQRGCQLSLQVIAPDVDGRAVYEAIERAGVFCDWRYPDVIRVAPTPLYNSFAEIHRFVEILDRAIPA